MSCYENAIIEGEFMFVDILCCICDTSQCDDWITFFKIIEGVRVSKAVCDSCAKMSKEIWIESGWSYMK